MDLTPVDLRRMFLDRFNSEPILIRSPGRINLIGEHTDYNDGLVMPAAVDKEIYFAIGPSGDDRSLVYSVNYKELLEVDINDPAARRAPTWANFLLGVVYRLRQNGYSLTPFNCVFGGNIPLGAGMSSSAALECGFAYALSELHGLDIPPLKLVAIGQWAEHHYVGVKCGIMDQFANVMGRQGHAIVLDCRSMTHRYSPLTLGAYGIILCDTKVKHSLVTSEYNTRRAECEAGVHIVKHHYPEVESLRDVTIAMLERHRAEFPGRVYQRCLYVVEEIARVQEASRDLDNGNLKAFGEKMFATHRGLSEQYEVSCEELDFLVSEAKTWDSVLGARMMGGGFGGCTINLVRNDLAAEFISEMHVRYREAFSIDMSAYPVRVVDGTSRVTS